MSRKRKSFVYVIESIQGHIKIGFSTNPQSRANTVNAHSPIPCRLIAVLDGDMKEEYRLHRFFEYASSHSEWFHPVAEITEFVKAVRWTGCEQIGFPASGNRAEARKEAARKRSEAMKRAWADPTIRENFLWFKRKRQAESPSREPAQ